MEDNKEEKALEKNSVKHEQAIAKHSNRLAMTPLRNFNAQEIDRVFGLLFYLAGKREQEVVISFNEITNLLGIERRGKKKLLAALFETSKKYGSIIFEEQTEDGFSMIHPFIGFKADAKMETFTVQVHPEFVKELNDLDGSSPDKLFTLSDVKAIVRVKSTYSKQALKVLFTYRNKGYWYVTVENLRYYLDIPPGYKPNDIKRRVIDVIEKELNEADIFEYFEITEHKEEGKRTTGRKRVLGYTFRFKFIEDESASKKGSLADKPSKDCPVCGRKMYLRTNRRDGSCFWGHLDGHRKDAKCSYTESAVMTEGDYSVVDDNVSDSSVNISRGDLERYYRYIREQEKVEAERRIEEVKLNDPVLWSYYEEREKKRFDAVRAVGAMTLSADGKREKERLNEEVRISTAKLEMALEERGYGKDHFDVHFRCPVCKDYGTDSDGYYCSCRSERAKEAVEWLKSMKGE